MYSITSHLTIRNFHQRRSVLIYCNCQQTRWKIGIVKLSTKTLQVRNAMLYSMLCVGNLYLIGFILIWLSFNLQLQQSWRAGMGTLNECSFTTSQPNLKKLSLRQSPLQQKKQRKSRPYASAIICMSARKNERVAERLRCHTYLGEDAP